jgi:hypothetical protein
MSTHTWDELVEAGKHLAGSNPQWELGDLVCEVETSYGDASLETYAKEIGSAFKTLQSVRTVAKAYPEKSLRGDNSFGVYKAFAAQPDRSDLVAARKWTVTEANEEVRRRSGKPKKPRPPKAEDLFPQALEALKKGQNRAQTARQLGLEHDSLPLAGAFGMAMQALSVPQASKPKNWNGKSNAQRVRNLQAQQRKHGYTELTKLQTEVAKACVILEDYDIRDYDLEGMADVALWSADAIYDDLISLGWWLDRSLMTFSRWLDDYDVRDKITKLRNTTGRTPEEAETALKLADRLEKKLEARLSGGAS